MPARKYKTSWDKLLAEIGVPREAVAQAPTGQMQCLLPDTSLFKEVWSDWTAIEPRVDSLARTLLNAIGSPADLIKIGAQALDLPEIPRFDAPDVDLLQAILACGGTPEDRIAELRSLIGRLPSDVRQAAARAIAVLPRAVAGVAQAFGVGPGGWAEWRKNLAPISPTELDAEVVEGTDISWLAVAGVDLAEAATAARRLAPRADSFELSWPTPLGRILIHSGDRREYDISDVAFLLSTGTHNTYRNGSVAGLSVAVAIHPGGGAIFRDPPAAVFGIQLIFTGRASAFFSNGPGAGAAFRGISLIHCTGDGQVFRGRSLCQGSAACGISIVATDGRDCVFECESFGQGFGGIRGFGCLLTSRGGCIYHAAVGAAPHGSAQDARFNTSMAQGVGMGRRGVPPNNLGIPEDPMCLPGGIGILVNGGGDNSFTCGLFGQGSAYWHALGALVVYGPNNRFDGIWYTQGAAAHCAVGCLLDLGGGSSFLTRLNHGQGAGHDYSVGLLHSVGRGSSFRGGTQRLGVGHGNGMGLCAIDEGENYFALSGESLACVVENSDLRPGQPCFGFFFCGGTPIFEGDDAPRSPFWIRPTSGSSLFQFGAGHVPVLSTAGQIYVTEASHFSDTPSGAVRRFADFLRAVGTAGSVSAEGQAVVSPIRCLRRSNRERCLGHTRVERAADGIHWACTHCLNQGIITGWQGTDWDQSKHVNSDPDTRVALRVSQDEYDALTSVFRASGHEEAIVAAAIWQNGQAEMVASDDEFALLAASLASEANHTKNRRIRKALNGVADKLDLLLSQATDG